MTTESTTDKGGRTITINRDHATPEAIVYFDAVAGSDEAEQEEEQAEEEQAD
jgi:hypothetical protein